MREIVLDTETTGFYHNGGDRIVEIGCVELINHVATGKVYHQQINPEREMPEAAYKVHGLSTELLSSKPKFAEIVDDFLAFIGNDKLVIHNASFDMNFLNAEFKRAGYKEIPMERAIDTLAIARKKFPGMKNNLDVLCQRFKIDNSTRTKHGALLDSELLSEVYLELLGGRELNFLQNKNDLLKNNEIKSTDKKYRIPRPHAPKEHELAEHNEFMQKIIKPIWFE